MEVVRILTDLVAVVGMEAGMAEDTEEGMVEATAEEEGVEGIRAEEVVVGEDTSVLLLLGSTLFPFASLFSVKSETGLRHVLMHCLYHV